MEEKKEKLAKVASSRKIHWSFTILGISFIFLSFFIAKNPDMFTQYGYVGIFTFNIVGSGLLLIPFLSAKFDLLLLIIISALGNILNTSINYFVGYAGRDKLPKFRLVDKTTGLIQKFGLFMIYILAVVPLPLDIAGLLSGYLRIPYKKYVFINFLGKVTIFTLVGIGVISFLKQ